MICIVKRFLIDNPNSEEIRDICFYQKHNDLYFVRIDKGDYTTTDNESVKINSINDISLYLPYLTFEDLKEIRKILRKSKISKLLEKK